MTERWLPVLGFEGHYEVSDLGRVRSVARTLRYEQRTASGRLITKTRHHPARVLQPGTVKSGHQLVMLGRGHPRLVHRLVLDAFVGPRPPGMEALHGDGDPANNRLRNLRWGTRSENVRDAIRHGTFVGGPKPGEGPNATLTAAHIPEIRNLLAAGLSPREIGERYGVTRSAIYLIKIGRNWSHISGATA